MSKVAHLSATRILAALLACLPLGAIAQVPPGGVPIPTAADYGAPSDPFGAGIGVDVRQQTLGPTGHSIEDVELASIAFEGSNGMMAAPNLLWAFPI